MTKKDKRKEEEQIIRDFMAPKEPRKSKQTLEVEAILRDPKISGRQSLDLNTDGTNSRREHRLTIDDLKQE